MANGELGFRSPTDGVYLLNPALDAMATVQLVDLMKRRGVVAELRYADGRVEPAPGPVLVSITSEADWVTKDAYRLGQWVDRLSIDKRPLNIDGWPSQSDLASHATGHLPFLASHRASSGKVKSSSSQSRELGTTRRTGLFQCRARSGKTTGTSTTPDSTRFANSSSSRTGSMTPACRPGCVQRNDQMLGHLSCSGNSFVEWVPCIKAGLLRQWGVCRQINCESLKRARARALCKRCLNSPARRATHGVMAPAAHQT